ncbi:crosslink repair DNA glycosylase YcaQ family protein [soil metagenome]
MDELAADEARLLSLRAQGLVGPRDRRGGPAAVLRRLGTVQLDTISVLARSHELVPYSRLGPVPRADVEAVYRSRPAVAFEHAGHLWPLEEWPYLAARRRRRLAWVHPRRPPDEVAMEEVRRIVRERGPITSQDLGGARSATPRPATVWWHWSALKIAAERLLDIGELACIERRGWRRVYDLAENAIPAALRRRKLSDGACHVHRVREAGVRLGVGTLNDLRDYFGGLATGDVVNALPKTGLVPVRVRGWEAPAWADPAALKTPVRGRHRTTLLSLFDTAIRDRARTRRLFAFDLKLEAYTPAAERIHGYFVMPLLARGRLRGRVDPARSGGTLVARKVGVDADAVEDLADALVEAASWVGCDAVAVELVTPSRLRAPLRRAIATRA